MNNKAELEYFEKYMKIAIEEAETAYKEDEVPVGAVIVENGNILARAHNRNRQTSDTTAHAEILALREASKIKGKIRLTESDIFITVEPCPMCAGAIIYGRIKRVIYGCADLKAGCDVSVLNILDNPKFNHRTEVVRNIKEEECKKILRDFFQEKRVKNAGLRYNYAS
ncbi:MAG TPA: tRNA adenosine(34) deaminase TadA [bacterium]|nr:tRNA adenosine(34) deaminase TadA [bacterium]